MKRTMVAFYLFAVTAFNLFSQKSESYSPVSADSGYIHVDGGKLFYEITGKGENIVLLHDGMVDGQIDLAIKNYEKSLEIDPKNENARKALKGLKEAK